MSASPPTESYLSIECILAAAEDTGADAVHPGYGFLSENADFAEACAGANLVFIGPSPASIRAMGSKSAAKTLMAEAGVPLVPGYHGAEQDDATLVEAAAGIGYPVLVKASAGGGGRGMRIVREAGELVDALASARREAMAAFGEDRLLLERYLENARHIEVQVFGDRHGSLVHMFERDCSVQRRYQKVIEEAPAPNLSDDLRARLHNAALRAARAVDYVNAGTVEFIVAGDEAWFMEMNTRLQVEHPVTEAITGLDLVEWQIRVARGERLPLPQKDIRCRGHAIETRLYAEDPQRDFLPQGGRLELFHLPPRSPNSRFDMGYSERDIVGSHYDSLIGKVIVHDRDRAHTVGHMSDVLDLVNVAGPKTNKRFLLSVLRDPAFVAADVDVQFVTRNMDRLAPPPSAAPAGMVGLAAWLVLQQSASGSAASPWASLDGWQSNLPPNTVEIALDDGLSTRRARLVSAGAEPQQPFAQRLTRWSIDGRVSDVAIALDPEAQTYRREGGPGSVEGIALRRGDRVMLLDDSLGELTFRVIDPRAAPAGAVAGGGQLVAPMPGTVAAVAVAAGEAVTAGQTLVVVEAMKMEHAVKAPHDGTVTRIDCAPGDLVREGQELVVLEAAS